LSWLSTARPPVCFISPFRPRCSPSPMRFALYGTWGERLSKDGYLVLLPDSFGSRGHGDLCAVQPPSACPVQADREIPRDNYGALAYLRTRPDVKPNSIAILGQPFGAASMFYTIAEGTRPKKAVSRARLSRRDRLLSRLPAIPCTRTQVEASPAAPFLDGRG
jgi:hypothetical protein